MIKAKNGKVKGNGTDTELIADLAHIISTLLTDADINEEFINIAVSLGKALAQNKVEECKKEILDNLKKDGKTMVVNLSELMKQVKEEKEENEEKEG